MNKTSVPMASRTTPQRVLKIALIVLGLAVIAVAGFFLFRVTLIMRDINPPLNPNPMPFVTTAVGLMLLGGLITGIGLGAPRRTARAIAAGVGLDGFTDKQRAERAEKIASQARAEQDRMRAEAQTPSIETRSTTPPTADAPTTRPADSSTNPGDTPAAGITPGA